MIKRILGWLVLVPLCAVLIVFALANRHAVVVHFDPLSPDVPLLPNLNVPLYAVIYGMLIIGIILGGVASWFAQGAKRRERRLYKRDAERLTRELEQARKAPKRAAAENALLSPDDFLDDE